MKTKEFVEKVEKLGYNIEIDWPTIYIKCDGCILARVDKARPYTIDTKAAFEVKHAKELFNLCTEYAKTPIEDREEEKKFYLQKMKTFYDRYYDETTKFLNVRKDQDRYDLGTTGQTFMIRTQFTQKEIDKIKEEQHTDLSEFEQIPVEDIEA